MFEPTTKTLSDGYKKRFVFYEKIHSIKQKDMDRLIKAINPREGEVILDLMSGYGSVTTNILEYTNKNNTSVNTVLLDNYKEQLVRSDLLVLKIIADARKLPFLDNSVDKIIIKMGLHEIPKKEQQKVVNEVFRVLKKGGEVFIWEMLSKDTDEQLLFQKSVRKKDGLAGFHSFCSNRYFLREDELLGLLENSNFVDVKVFHRFKYTLSTKGRLESEFLGDTQKLDEWNNYIRTIITDEQKTKFGFVDKGETIQLTFNFGLVKAIK
jgi:ubiquinone/menaquinone biosynthesis C-methylase UbiE